MRGILSLDYYHYERAITVVMFFFIRAHIPTVSAFCSLAQALHIRAASQFYLRFVPELAASMLERICFKIHKPALHVWNWKFKNGETSSICRLLSQEKQNKTFDMSYSLRKRVSRTGCFSTQVLMHSLFKMYIKNIYKY
jgi:hypothetical protein